jgi:hypothetical protein
MRSARLVTTGAFTVLIALSVLAACVGDDPGPAANTGDASSSGTSSSGTSGPSTSGTSGTNGTSGNPSTGGPEAGSADDDAAGPDADAGVPETGGPPPNFCQSPAAAGAVFCADFETSSDVTNGWDPPTIAGGATITRNTGFGGQSSSASATLKLSAGSTGSQATLSKSITFTSKQKVDIDYDAYFVFPTPWSGTTWNDFVTGVTRTAGVHQFYFDLERQYSGASEWIATETTGPAAGSALSSALTPAVWHHIKHTYDATEAGANVKILVDDVLVVSVALAKGTADTQAPSTFDQIFVNAGVENDGTGGTATELTLDNVMVHVF